MSAGCVSRLGSERPRRAAFWTGQGQHTACRWRGTAGCQCVRRTPSVRLAASAALTAGTATSPPPPIDPVERLAGVFSARDPGGPGRGLPGTMTVGRSLTPGVRTIRSKRPPCRHCPTSRPPSLDHARPPPCRNPSPAKPCPDHRELRRLVPGPCACPRGRAYRGSISVPGRSRWLGSTCT